MIRFLAAIALSLLTAGATERIQGWCEVGSTAAVTNGFNSSNKVQGSFPQCTVTVTIVGGGSATLYSNATGSSLSNPFTADAQGHWFFYVANGRYNVTLSGGGFGSPYTIGDILAFDYADLGTYQAKNYGVKCDGSTDDTVAIQAAINAVISGGGGDLVFPSGTCVVDSYNADTTITYTRYSLAVANSGSAISIGFVGQNTTIESPLSFTNGSNQTYVMLFYVTGNYSGFSMTGFTLYSSHSLTSCATVAMFVTGGASYTISNLNVSQVTFQDWARGVGFDGITGVSITNNFWVYDLGRDSASTNNSMPAVGLWSGQSGNPCYSVIISGNLWNGAVGTVGTNQNQAADGLIFGVYRGLTAQNNFIWHHSAEAIKVSPRTSDTTVYPVLIAGNRIDSTLAPGSSSNGTVGIRCDESNVLITGNVINQSVDAIFTYGPGYSPFRITNQTITGNSITGMTAAEGTSEAGIYVDSVDGVTVTNNTIVWPNGIATVPTQGSWGIYTPYSTIISIINNNIQCINKAGSGTLLQAIGLQVTQTAVTGGNTISGVDVVYEFALTNTPVTIGNDNLVSYGTLFTLLNSANLTGVLWPNQTISFTPSTSATGWYRILSGALQYLYGRVQIDANYDNSTTDVVAEVDMPGYGQPSTINETRYLDYNAGVISEMRLSSTNNNTYLDIYVSSASSPGPITVNFQTNVPGLILSQTPAHSPSAGSNVYALNLGPGLVSNQFPNCNTLGTAPSCGTATLSGGTVTVSNTGANGSYLYFFSYSGCFSCGTLSKGTVVNGTSFVINSTNGSDTSPVFWMIVHPQ